MKREEKNQQTRRRILDGAVAEFSQQGYLAGSMNAICARQGISKGIIYHYFRTKDDLFLACVDECFAALTEYMESAEQHAFGTISERLVGYFSARSRFFTEHPQYQRFFYLATIAPPEHLRASMQEIRQPFDRLNVRILSELIAQVSLRPHITPADVIELFQRFQDFLNVHETVVELNAEEFEAQENRRRKALDILLYGVVERGDEV